MIIIPNYAVWMKADESPELADRHDGYSEMSDDELNHELDRVQRLLNDLSRSHGADRANGEHLVNLDHEVECLTNELVRRARARHPSSRSSAG